MNIILFLIVLVALIVVHEFGHFIVAKRSGIRVDEFGIGFPPRMLTFWKKGETIYTLNWLPFGGFVKIFGENADEVSSSESDKERSFIGKPKKIQVLVLVAGVVANILIAWVLFSIVFMVGTPAAVSSAPDRYITDKRLSIVSVLPNSPAWKTGLISGDAILSLSAGGESVKALTPDAVSSFIGNHADSEFLITIRRNGEVLKEKLMTNRGIIESEPDRAVIGIGMGLVGTLRLPLHLALYEAAKSTWTMLVAVTLALLSFFAGAFTLSADLSQVTGPVGIVSLVGDAASFGLVSLLTFTALISINLAVINLLPIPALDGGRILFVLIEAVKGSPIRPVVVNTLNTLGFLFLILLMIAITYNDILRIVG